MQAPTQTNDPTPDVAGVLRRARFIDAVLLRLQTRHQLTSLAREVFGGLASASSPQPAVPTKYVGEMDDFNVCGNSGFPINFQCSKNGADKFECTTFTCGSTYGDCDKAAGSTFECKKDFDCKNDFFDCAVFSCGNPTAAAGSYNCDEKKDFICGGADFDCHDDFDCTAGHGFFCTDNHECKDSFECKSPGKPQCDGTPGNQYDAGDGGDTTAGDFLCGINVPGSGDTGDKFDCTTTFDCNSSDDFDCMKNTTFNCGDAAGDTFNCGKTTTFECDTTFDCKGGAGKFNCLKGEGAGKFECGKGAYSK